MKTRELICSGPFEIKCQEQGKKKFPFSNRALEIKVLLVSSPLFEGERVISLNFQHHYFNARSGISFKASKIKNVIINDKEYLPLTQEEKEKLNQSQQPSYSEGKSLENSEEMMSEVSTINFKHWGTLQIIKEASQKNREDSEDCFGLY